MQFNISLLFCQFLAIFLVAIVFYRKNFIRYSFLALVCLCIVYLQAFHWDYSFNSGGFRVNILGITGGDDIKYASSIFSDQWLTILGPYAYVLRVFSLPFSHLYSSTTDSLGLSLQIGLGLQSLLYPSIIISSFSIYRILSSRKLFSFNFFSLFFLLNGFLIYNSLVLLRESLVCLLITRGLLSLYRSKFFELFIYLLLSVFLRPMMGISYFLIFAIAYFHFLKPNSFSQKRPRYLLNSGNFTLRFDLRAISPQKFRIACFAVLFIFILLPIFDIATIRTEFVSKFSLADSGSLSTLLNLPDLIRIPAMGLFYILGPFPSLISYYSPALALYAIQVFFYVPLIIAIFIEYFSRSNTSPKYSFLWIYFSICMLLSAYSLQFRHKTSIIPMFIILALMSYEDSKFSNYFWIVILSAFPIFILII